MWRRRAVGPRPSFPYLLGGCCGHGLNPSLLKKGKLSWRGGKATVLWRRRGVGPPRSFPLSSEESRKVSMASALLSLREGGPAMKGVCPPLSQGGGHETMVSFLSVSVENGWCGHGLSPASLLYKGKLSWRRGKATLLWRRRGVGPPRPFPFLFRREQEGEHG